MGDLQIVQDLIAAGADVNHQRQDGFTALMRAAFWGHLEVTRFLIDTGADVNHQNQYGNTVLIFAADRGHLEIVQTLIDAGADVNHQNRFRRETALMVAARREYLEITRSLIDAGADVNRQSKDGFTALEIATRRGHTEIEALIEDRAEVSFWKKFKHELLNLFPGRALRETIR